MDQSGHTHGARASRARRTVRKEVDPRLECSDLGRGEDQWRICTGIDIRLLLLFLLSFF